MQRPTLQQQIDACQIGGQGLDGAELSELREALHQNGDVRAAFSLTQEIDERVMAVIENVPTPIALEQRLLAALREAEFSLSAAEDPSGAVATPSRLDALSGTRHRESRRHPVKWLVTSAALLLLAGLVGYAAVVLLSDPSPISSDEVTQRTLGWLDRTAVAEWRSDLSQSPLEELTLDNALQAEYRTRAPAWQPLSSEFGHGAVYLLSDDEEGRIYQFTIRTDAEFAVSSVLPRTPQLTTQNLCIGICHRDVDGDGDGDVLVVLVVEGQESRYQSVLRDRPPVI